VHSILRIEPTITFALPVKNVFKRRGVNNAELSRLFVHSILRIEPTITFALPVKNVFKRRGVNLV